MIDDASEAVLLDAASSGDRRAFTRLMTPHRDRLWGVCYRITSNNADAEDAVQNCMVSIWRSLPRFRGESAFSTWVYRIAANSAIAVVRKRGQEVAVEVIFDKPDGRPGIDDTVGTAIDVQAALMAMREDFRVALVLREYGGYTYEEIAEYQKVSVGVVKSRLFRARAKVRSALTVK